MTLPSTKVVVLGESEVGKSSLVAALCRKTTKPAPSTVGVEISIAWHDYKPGSPEQKAEMIELWDIGGAAAHRPASTVFLDGAAGVLLVHDLTNSKSEENLGAWLALLKGDRRPLPSLRLSSLLADMESSQIPILLVGTKLDQAKPRSEGGGARIYLDCRREIAAGSSTAMAISRFFDACIGRGRGSPIGERSRRRIHAEGIWMR